MSDAGAPAEAIALAVEAIEARDAVTEARKAKDRNRKRREPGNSTEIPTPFHGNSAEIPHPSEETPEPSNEIPAPRVYAPAPVLCGAEEVVIPPQSTTYSSPKPASAAKANSRKPTARNELAEVLGDELAAEVVAHRQRMRAPMSPQTAVRLAKDFLDSGNPQEAAKFMMDRGWKNFKPDWWRNATAPPPARAGPLNGHPAKPSTLSALHRMSNNGKQNPSDGFDFEQQTPDHDGPTLDLDAVEVPERH
jgi:hypothetical protein